MRRHRDHIVYLAKYIIGRVGEREREDCSLSLSLCLRGNSICGTLKWNPELDPHRVGVQAIVCASKLRDMHAYIHKHTYTYTRAIVKYLPLLSSRQRIDIVLCARGERERTVHPSTEVFVPRGKDLLCKGMIFRDLYKKNYTYISREKYITRLLQQ